MPLRARASLRDLGARAVGRLRRSVAGAIARSRDVRARTYPDLPTELAGDALARYFAPLPPALVTARVEETVELARHACEHRFDLLGSGWTRVIHGMSCRGLDGHRFPPAPPVRPDPEGAWLAGRVNRTNLQEAKRIWSLVDPDHHPIDWHLDFKSGYRWREATWYRDVPIGHLPGVDVKVPWELARMQHLPQLVRGYVLAREGAAGTFPPEAYVREFRNQVLDFIATNPPRFGVNWRTSMDVAIRVCNWLAAYDLFRAHGATFDPAFERELSRTVYAHGLHITRNLEWEPNLRANHYLANVVGLLFVAAYLPRSRETDAWLAYAVQELVGEVEYQFTGDGANFEASTCYHRLSAEMVAYGTALVLALPPARAAALAEYDDRVLRGRPPLRPAPLPLHPAPLPLYPAPDGGPATPFRAGYAARLGAMAEFTMHVTKPSGRVAQIGDNDSGRLFKLVPAYRRMPVGAAKARYTNLAGYGDLPDGAVYWDEDHLDHRHLVAAIGGLTGRSDLAAFADGHPEAEIVRVLAGGRAFGGAAPPPTPVAEGVRIGTDAVWAEALARLARDPTLTRVRRVDAAPEGGLHPLSLYGYPAFGCYILRAPGLFLCIRCGDVGQRGNGGHAHNDQLSVELTVDGRDLWSDPGTYLYTPLPEQRNRYRSALAHAAPRVDRREPARLDRGLFRLGAGGAGRCVYFGPRGFIGMHEGYGNPVYRIVAVEDEVVSVTDHGRGLDSPDGEAGEEGFAVPFSPGYGIRHG